MDSQYALFNRNIGFVTSVYIPISGGKVDYSGITSYSFKCSNRVINEKNGRDSPSAETSPIGEGKQYYYPQQMPLGEHNLSKSFKPDNEKMGKFAIKTDAEQMVKVFGSVDLGMPKPFDGMGFVPIGEQKDAGYWFHESLMEPQPSSWGCGVTYGDSAEEDMAKFAERSDKALESGGQSKVVVTE